MDSGSVFRTDGAVNRRPVFGPIRAKSVRLCLRAFANAHILIAADAMLLCKSGKGLALLNS